MCMQVHRTYDCKAATAADMDNEGLPSFIVMDLGESLYAWSDRAQPNLFQTVAVRNKHSCTSMHGLAELTFIYAIVHHLTDVPVSIDWQQHFYEIPGK